jgi:hypothetical protein
MDICYTKNAQRIFVFVYGTAFVSISLSIVMIVYIYNVLVHSILDRE